MSWVQAVVTGTPSFSTTVRKSSATPAAANPGSSQDHRAWRCMEPPDHVLTIPRNLGRHPRRFIGERIVRSQGCLIDHCRLHIDGNIEPAWSRTPGAGQIPGLLQLMADAARIGHQLRILRDAAHHSDDIRFLIAELAQTGDRNWTCRSRALPGRTKSASAPNPSMRRTRHSTR